MNIEKHFNSSLKYILKINNNRTIGLNGPPPIIGLNPPPQDFDHGWVYDGCGGLVVRVSTCSLFHDEKFCIFHFGVRGNP